MAAIVDFWRRFVPLDGGDLLHPEDQLLFRQAGPAGTRTYVHTRLIPSPYLGSLREADIFVVLLNPGFSQDDYEAETRSDFRSLKYETLFQDFSSRKLKVDFFDPELSWHPGYRWMRQTFGSLHGPALDRRLALLEIFPYHSQEFSGRSILLPSVIQMQAYVLNDVLPRARRGEILLIVARGNQYLGIAEQSDDIIVYRGGECRRAYLTPNSRGGRAIALRLNQ